MERSGRYRGDWGETLVEVLVSVVLLGIAGVALLAGMAGAAKASALHRAETTGGAQVRTFAEDIQSWVTANPSSYVNCPTDSTDNPDGTVAVAGTYGSSVVGFATPAGFKAGTVTVKTLDKNGVPLMLGACSPDIGLQLLTLSLTSSDGNATEKLTFVLRRPCDTSAVSACS